MSRRRPSASFALSFSLASLGALAACLAVGCSSSTSSPGPTSDTGTVGGDTAVVDTGRPAADTAPADTAPAACWIVSPADPALNKCGVCSQVKCKDKWDAAYGPAFVSSGGKTTGGACSDFAKCMCACSEVDAICTEACKVSQSDPCKTAARAIYDCEGTSCAVECGRGLL
ncbi:MAG: hypothetical protein NVSMB47_12380 [Polyangiales bacterium]